MKPFVTLMVAVFALPSTLMAEPTFDFFDKLFGKKEKKYYYKPTYDGYGAPISGYGTHGHSGGYGSTTSSSHHVSSGYGAPVISHNHIDTGYGAPTKTTHSSHVSDGYGAPVASHGRAPGYPEPTYGGFSPVHTPTPIHGSSSHDSYGAPAAPAISTGPIYTPAASTSVDSYGAPSAPAISYDVPVVPADSYGSPIAPTYPG